MTKLVRPALSTWPNRLRYAPAVAAAAVIAVLVIRSGHPNPPLLTSDQADSLAKASNPYAALDGGSGATTADNTVLIEGQALQLRAQKDFSDRAALEWPAASSARPTLFAEYNNPTLDCPSPPSDGQVCTLTFAPRSEPHNDRLAEAIIRSEPPALLAASMVPDDHLYVRMDIDDGVSPYLRPPADPRPPPASEVPVQRIVAGDGFFAPFGKLPVVCRVDDYASGPLERRNCSIEFGPNRLTVSRDVPMANASAFTQIGDDKTLTSDLQDAAKFFALVVGGDPVLVRALEPVRSQDIGEAFMDHFMDDQSSADHIKKIRSLVSTNAPLIPWHDVASQAEFEVVCKQAAKEDRRMLIFTAEDVNDAIRALMYDKVFKSFADNAMLVMVRMQPPVGADAWATGFVDAIGASRAPAVTVTDKPWMAGQRCAAGKLYQAPASALKPEDLVGAVMKGRSPPQTIPKKD